MKLVEKYGKKKVLMMCGVVLALLIVIGGISWYTMEQNHKQEVLDSIDVVFKEDVFIEYGQEKVDFNEYIKEKKGEPEISLPQDEIDTKVLGKKDLVYKISKEGYSKDKNLSIEIKDTKAPEIVLNEEKVEITEGDEFDPASNIKSVKDPVDGDINKSDDDKIEKNGYLIQNDVDTSTPNEYTVTIIAFDSNGNKSEKEYTVTVEAKEEQPKNSQTSNGTTSNGTGGTSGKTSNGGNQSSGGGGTSAPAEEPHYRTDISSSYASQINAYRQQNGLDALPITAEAQAEADMRAMQLVSNFAHNSSNGFVENIGMGDVGYNFFEAWVASPNHNATMLERSMSKALAVSVVEYNGKWYAVTSFHANYA